MILVYFRKKGVLEVGKQCFMYCKYWMVYKETSLNWIKHSFEVTIKLLGLGCVVACILLLAVLQYLKQEGSLDRRLLVSPLDVIIVKRIEGGP